MYMYIIWVLVIGVIWGMWMVLGVVCYSTLVDNCWGGCAVLGIYLVVRVVTVSWMACWIRRRRSWWATIGSTLSMMRWVSLSICWFNSRMSWMRVGVPWYMVVGFGMDVPW